jgi:hypothetical protein
MWVQCFGLDLSDSLESIVGFQKGREFLDLRTAQRGPCTVKLVKNLLEPIQVTEHGSRLEQCEVWGQDPRSKDNDLPNQPDVILQENPAIICKTPRYSSRVSKHAVRMNVCIFTGAKCGPQCFSTGAPSVTTHLLLKNFSAVRRSEMNASSVITVQRL